MMKIQGEQFVLPKSSKWTALLIAVGTFGFLGQILLTLGLRREKVGRASLGMYLQIVFALIFEKVFFNTTPEMLSVVGASLIIATSTIVAMNKNKNKTEEKENDERETLLRDERQRFIVTDAVSLSNDKDSKQETQAFVPSSEDFKNLNPTSSWDHTPFPGAIHDEPLGGDYSDPSGIEPPSEEAPDSPNGEGYELVKDMQGEEFFDYFYFYADEDPTHGYVDYVDSKYAFKEGLAGMTDSGRPFFRVESTPKITGPRKSIRLESNFNYTGGVVLLDVWRVPGSVCGLWPAFWSNGETYDWPEWGEIDIIEGVNAFTENQSSFHTASGCYISEGSSNKFTGKLTHDGELARTCSAFESNNEGCGIKDNHNNTYGTPLNKRDGGVFAMQWLPEYGISTWFFPRGHIPEDIEKGKPSPSQWGKPYAHLSNDGCEISEYFKHHQLIFDTTLAGDWSGRVWAEEEIWQEETCANMTGYATAEEYIREEGEAFEDAVWEIGYVKLYQ
ncbi:hypothetical protein E3Q01_02280 [Wallemia mellicola]|uniref:GH16 domain-containing protein n=1 Tax=Wallemia mellicola TaxID=1708541 RepID=A0A4T0TKB1_9BASI|nr:hypothetical protein E3Q01_02280 [Wallemia mellicola]